jgi:hypothetical protein
VSSNEYSSIICFFLENYVTSNLRTGQNMIIWTDGCFSQNTKQYLAINHNATKTNNKTACLCNWRLIRCPLPLLKNNIPTRVWRFKTYKDEGKEELE